MTVIPKCSSHYCVDLGPNGINQNENEFLFECMLFCTLTIHRYFNALGQFVSSFGIQFGALVTSLCSKSSQSQQFWTKMSTLQVIYNEFSRTNLRIFKSSARRLFGSNFKGIGLVFNKNVFQNGNAFCYKVKLCPKADLLG